jgi:hypothetical protein
MKNPVIIEYLDKKGKVISMNYYLSAQDFITENKDMNVNVIMYITHRITSKMRIKYDIQKDNKFYFIKNDQLILI